MPESPALSAPRVRGGLLCDVLWYPCLDQRPVIWNESKLLCDAGHTRMILLLVLPLEQPRIAGPHAQQDQSDHDEDDDAEDAVECAEVKKKNLGHRRAPKAQPP